jgi:hypothetical protein
MSGHDWERYQELHAEDLHASMNHPDVTVINARRDETRCDSTRTLSALRYYRSQAAKAAGFLALRQRTGRLGRMGRGIAVVHIGTHKTGSTSFQAVLTQQAHLLEEWGTYYPKAGRVRYGQHNLAWQLGPAGRYKADLGSLDDLLSELRAVRPPSMILSSEDFGCLYRQRGGLRDLRRCIIAAGYSPRIVVSLRSPASYLPSLYAQLMKKDPSLSLQSVVAMALEQGGVVFRWWDFRLDYSQLLLGFSSVFGARNLQAVEYNSKDAISPLLGACSSWLGNRLDSLPTDIRENVTSMNRPHSPELTADQAQAISAAFDDSFYAALERYSGVRGSARFQRLGPGHLLWPVRR